MTLNQKNFNFNIYKNDGQYIGASEGENPKIAASNYFRFGQLRRNITDNEIEVNMIDENTFRVFFRNEQYILRGNI